jgi:hypothetical protein
MENRIFQSDGLIDFAGGNIPRDFFVTGASME